MVYEKCNDYRGRDRYHGRDDRSFRHY
jgi:hypothetical protein